MENPATTEIATDLSTLTSTIESLATALSSTVAKNGSLTGTFKEIQTSNNQAAVSANAAVTLKTSASGSANAAASSATNASNSASAASTDATNAGTSATTASTKATAANSSASSALSSQTAAATSASNASVSATHVGKLKQVAPAHAANFFDGSVAGDFAATVSFTAPCNGYVVAYGILNSSNATASFIEGILNINGNVMAADNTGLNQKYEAALFVTSGTVVTVTFTAVNPTAAGVSASLYAFAFFVPAST